RWAVPSACRGTMRGCRCCWPMARNSCANGAAASISCWSTATTRPVFRPRSRASASMTTAATRWRPAACLPATCTPPISATMCASCSAASAASGCGCWKRRGRATAWCSPGRTIHFPTDASSCRPSSRACRLPPGASWRTSSRGWRGPGRAADGLATAPLPRESLRLSPQGDQPMHRTISRATGLLLLLVLAWPVLAAQAGLTLEQVAKTRTVTRAEISPDGRHVAYVLSVPREVGVDDDGPARAELHVATREGDSRGFVTGKVNVGGAEWLPDSRSLAYLAKREGAGTRTLDRIPVDGGESVAVAKLKSDISAFSLSPDGRRVALLASAPESDALKALKKKGFSQKVYEEDWRPVQLWI